VPYFGAVPGPVDVGEVWAGNSFSGCYFGSFPCGLNTPALLAAAYQANSHATASCTTGPLGQTCTYGPNFGTPPYGNPSANETDSTVQALDVSALGQLQVGLLSALLQGNQAAGNVSSGGVQQALQRLDGAKDLLVDYASLGLSSTLDDDDTLAGLIRGSNELPGGTAVVNALQAALKAAQGGTYLTGDPATTIVEPALIANGASALDKALESDIAQPTGSNAEARTADVAASGAGVTPAQENPFVDSVADRLALTTSSFGAGPAVTLSAPADGATVTSATFSGTAADGPAVSPTVTVDVYPTSDTSAQPVATATATESGGKWSLTVPGLAAGSYTAQAQESDTASPANVGHSTPVQFTLAPATTPPSGGGGGSVSAAGSGGGASSGSGAGTSGSGAGGQSGGSVTSGGGISTPVAYAAVSRVAVHGDTATVTVTCTGTAAAQCGVKLLLSLTEQLKGGHVTAITAAALGRAKVTTKTVTLATTTATIAVGHTQRITLTLNRAAARLLAARHQLPATLTVTTTGGQRTSTLSRQRTVFHATQSKRHP